MRINPGISVASAGALSLATVLLTLLLVLPATSSAAVEYVPDDVIVKFKPESSPVQRMSVLEAVDGAGSEGIGLPRTRLVELEDGAGDPEAVARRLERRPEVAWAEPNYIYRTMEVRSNDPFFTDGSLWGLLNTGQTVPQFVTPETRDDPRAGLPGIDIGAISAWEESTGSRSVLVGVADTGVASHSDLNANLRFDLSRDFRADTAGGEEDDPFADSYGHGTHVAGTIGEIGRAHV